MRNQIIRIFDPGFVMEIDKVLTKHEKTFSDILDINIATKCVRIYTRGGQTLLFNRTDGWTVEEPPKPVILFTFGDGKESK